MADKLLFEIVVDTKGVPKGVKQVKQAKKGVDDLSRSTKRLEKNQTEQYTRQKQGVIQTANSTKNFSKMQQSVDGGGGAGGLVRAYALLAANVFALTAAFGVLSRSAQVDTLIESMEILSTTGGTYIQTIARDMQAASGFAVDLAQSFRQVSLASSAGLSTKEIEGLTTVAKGAAISLGRDLPDAMDRIFRGAIKMEPEILDEIGLFVRVDEAAQQYARELGKSTAALTLTEKRQAFLNQILEQGTRKFEEYAEAIEPDIYTQLSSSLLDLSQSATSVINSALGPAIRFLTENPKMLALAFGGLVAFLLGKAIPALGVFNFDVAKGARDAVAAEQEYIAKIQDSLNAEVSAEKIKRQEWLESKRIKQKAMMDADKTQKRFISRAGGAKANLKSLKKETDIVKRKELLTTRIGILKKAEKKATGENLELIKKEVKEREKELRNMRSQVKAQQDITRLEREQSLEAQKGTLAAKRLAKLQDKATSTTIIAGATGIAETEGLKAGFANLGKTLREGVTDEVTGATHKLKGMRKGMTALKGSVSILGVGFQSLMMTLGPFIMAFTLLLPLLVKFGEWLGLNSKEAAHFDDNLKNLEKSLENIDKRFTAQVKGMKNTKLEWVENQKAVLSFYKGSIQAAEGMIKVNDAFNDFIDSASNTAKAWEAVKKFFGGGRELANLKVQVQGLSEILQGMISKDIEEALTVFGDHLLPQTIKNISGMSDAARDAERALSLLGNQTNYDSFITMAGTWDEVETSLRRNIIAMTDDAKVRKEAVIQYVRTQRAIRGIAAETEISNLTDKERVALIQKNIEHTKAQAQAYETLISAFEGAKESVGKFQQAFLPKTKVDEVLSNFLQMEHALHNKLLEPEAVEKFWQSFADGTNKFAALFDKEKELTRDRTGQILGLKDTFATNEEIFAKIRKEFQKYQVTVLTTKQEIQKLTRENKQLAKVTLGGGVGIEKMQKNITQIAKKSWEIQKQLTVATARSMGLEREGLEVKLARIDAITNEEERQKALGELGLDDVKFLSLKGALIAENNKELDKEIEKHTQSDRIILEQSKNLLKILNTQHEYTKSLQKTTELEFKLSNLKAGGTGEITPARQAQLEVRTAQEKYQFDVASAMLKKKMLEAEERIMIMRLKVTALELGLAKKNDKGEIVVDQSIQNMIDTIGSSFTASRGIIDEGLKQSALEFGIVLQSAMQKGFKDGGFLGGIRAAAKAVAADTTAGTPEGDAAAKGGDAVVDSLTQQKLVVDALRGSFQLLADTMGDFGPAGILVQGIAEGSLTIMNGMANMKQAFEDVDLAVEEGTLGFSSADAGMAKAAATAEVAASALSGIGQMLAANAKSQIAEIDQQINAEKKRDGKSKESLAKIAQMEKKKEGMQRKAFETQKKTQMAVTVANTAASIMAAVSAPPIGLGWPAGIPFAAMAAAMGALQLAVISKTKYAGGSSEAPKAQMAALSIGKRSEKVDVSRGATGGELGYLRGQRGMGKAGDFVPTGGAAGLRKGYAEGGVLVGERGPEVIAPRGSYEVTPNDALGGPVRNVNFTINAVDAAGVDDVLLNRRGYIIEMLREAANDTGERFLESVDTDVVGVG